MKQEQKAVKAAKPPRPTPAPFFSLVVGDGNNIKVDNASVPVRWCVNADLMAQLKKRADDSGMHDPHVVLNVAHKKFCSYDNSHDGYDVLSRVVLPIGDAMAYLSIHRPDAAEIHATIIDFYKGTSAKQTKKVLRLLTQRSGSGYRFSMHDDYDCGKAGVFKTEYRDVDSDIRCYMEFVPLTGNVTDSVEIETPKELFATPLPNWFEKFINFGYESKLVDQCHIRRRAMVAVLWQSWAVPLWTMVVVFTRFMFAFGWQFLLGVTPNWKAVVKPFDCDFDDVSRSTSTYSKITWKDSHFLKKPWLLPFFPPVMLLIGALGNLFFAMGASVGYGFMMVLVIGLVTILAAIVLVAVGNFLFYTAPKYVPFLGWTGRMIKKVLLVSQIGSGLKKAWNGYWKWLDKRDAEAYARYWKENEEALTCQGNPLDMIADISKLHHSKKSVKLRFFDLKSKMCKPTAL